MSDSPQISLLVPFKPDVNAPERADTWRWLREYWGSHLPDAEIILGRSMGETFSKTEAVNDAAQQARGRIFVILDADCYIDTAVVQQCADDIEASVARGRPLWFMPYRHLYRLTRELSLEVLASDPADPLRLPSPPPSIQVESTLGSGHGHFFGAMIQIMPRAAFMQVGAMDPRFQGWGGEDIAFLRAVDTLYGKHKSTLNDVLHLWHPNVGATHETRMWQGQEKPRANGHLASRYNVATGDRARMRALVDEGIFTIMHGCPECPFWHPASRQT